ncbi:ABC transporter ATP-binding protein [Clostridium tarantellae]|uniref:ATP-binding cassette domain-containing protein n=1 Tax=Clostridium tarantellae TaxID=39493 RepID=A0A6I1MLC5_9CLOT|nr:ABC transporter ATP-binding protein [Clostridium tarantellae]MPQ42917.1 ATP-binding cassette domain-containing protein [Clostridium tarantellae]
MLKLLKYLKPYTLSVIAVVVLLFFYSLSTLYLPNLMANIIDKGVITGNTVYIFKTGGIMILFALGGSILAIISSYLSAKAGTSFAKDLRKDIFIKVSSYSLKKFDTIGTSSLITRSTNDINQIQQVILMFMRMMIIAPLTCIGGLIMALKTSFKLSNILLISIPLVALSIFIVGKKGIPLFKSMQVKLDKLNLISRENLTGIRVIRAFDKIKFEEKRFNFCNMALTNTAIKVNILMGILMPILMLILNLTSVAIMWYGAKYINSGTFEIGNLMAFIQYVMQIMMSLIMLSMMFILIPRASASADRVNEVLSLKNEIINSSSNKNNNILKGYVEFKNVSFKYPGAEEYTLKDISFYAKPGKTTAIIGSTGSGKSTIINLIPRFYDTTAGEIFIDGINIRNISIENLRKKIGLVPQKAILFSGTIADNLKYGKENALNEEIIKACKIAQAYNFVSEMPEGIHSSIAQGGSNVSGGQKQRLCIARALIRKPEIFLFDDSFSALDFKTDAKLRCALKKETKNSTIIVIAQRVSSIIDADTIIVLDNGSVVGKGTHTELLKSCKVYEEIVYSQLSKEEADA